MFMKRTLIAGAFVVATAVTAAAADIPAAAPAPPPPPPAPTFSFAGGYFGVQGGNFWSALAPVTAQNIGLHGGYNVEFGRIVAGVRLDANYVNAPALNTDLFGHVGFKVMDRLQVYGAAGIGYCVTVGPCASFGHILAGGGAEYLVTQRISVFGEVLGVWGTGGFGPLGIRAQVGVSLH